MLSSCNKDEQNQLVTDDGIKSVALSINLGDVSTKAEVDDEMDDPFVTDDPTQNFNTVDIFFTSSDGTIQYAFRAKSDETDGSYGQKIWDNLFDTGTGVRFIGLEGISGVYVFANSPLQDSDFDADNGKLAAGTSVDKVSDINAKLLVKDYVGDDKDAADMPYIGADISLVQAETVNDDSDANEVKLPDAVDVGTYYEASISIRPAISRVETQKVAVVTSGEAFFKTTEGGALEMVEKSNAEYKVTWSNFAPQLVGAYMSNIYTNTDYFPASNAPAITNWTAFETPAIENNTFPIKAGIWNKNVLAEPLNAVYSYANYSTEYSDLVSKSYRGGESTSTENAYYVLDGTKNSANKVLPFNFFVPYDVTSVNDAASVTALEGTITPKIHLQFKEVLDYQYDIFAKNADGNWSDTPLSNDPTVKAQIDMEMAWPTNISNTEEGIAFANVAFSTNGGGDAVLEVQPGYIYRLAEVVVNPFNLSGSLTSDEYKNIVVYVTVVRYAPKDIYPVFD